MTLRASFGAVGAGVDTRTRQTTSGLTTLVLVLGAPLRFWRTTLTVLALLASLRLAGKAGVPWWWGPAGLAILPILVLGGWALIHRESFGLVAWPWLRSGVRRWLIYAPGWRVWLTRCRLVTRDESRRVTVPRLLRVRSTRAMDRLTVEIPIGMTLEDFEHRADHLATAMRVETCRVRRDRPARLVLELRVRDLLATPVPAVALPAAPVVDVVTLGLREDGSPWRVPVLGVHRLVAGRSQAGKGSLMWGELLGLAPAISAGLVEVTAIDPKGGMELAVGRELFTRFEYDNPRAMVEAIENLADQMDQRARQLLGVARRATICQATPLRLLVVDELATLTLYSGPQIGTRCEQALGRLLTKGAAVGYLVRAYLQDPRKDSVPMRGLFTHRVALGLDTPGEVDMVLGDGAHARGAHADRIALAAKGTAYVLEDGDPQPYRVRAGYPTDELIREVAQHYRAPEVFQPEKKEVSSPAAGSTPRGEGAGVAAAETPTVIDGQAVYRPSAGSVDPAAPLLPPALLEALTAREPLPGDGGRAEQ